MANCLKCGKELSTTKAFCEECLEVMEKYPVPSGTPLVIYRRSAVPKKAPVKKKLSPEEQVVKLRRTVKQLTALLVVFAIIIAVGVAWLIREIKEPGRDPEATKGQNYSTQPTVTTTPTPTTTPPDTSAEDTTPPDTTVADTTPEAS